MKLIKKLLIILVIFIFIGIVVLRISLLRNNYSEYIEGNSMEPNYHNGEMVYFTKTSFPKINDVVILDCFSKCTDNYRYKYVREITLIKRVTNIDGDKIWIEGDNKLESVDSRVYGWLSPNDIRIDGVVIQ